MPLSKMASCGERCKQPCLPPTKCQQMSGVIDNLPGCTPQYRLQQQQSYTSWCKQPCAPQCRQLRIPQCAPQQLPCNLACPRQQRSCWCSQSNQPSHASPCKSVSFNLHQPCTPQVMRQCAPKGQVQCCSRCLQGCTPQQRTMKGSQHCAIRSSPQYTTKEGPICKTKNNQPSTSQEYVTMGGPVCITKGNRQNTYQPGITVGSPTCVVKSSRPRTNQQCVPTSGQVCISKAQPTGYKKGGLCSTTTQIASEGVKRQ